MTPLQKIVAAVTGVLALTTFLGVVKYKFPTPAWSTDIEFVQAQINDLDRRQLEEALGANQLRIYANQDRQQEYLEKGVKIPPYLREERDGMDTKRRRLQKRLDRLQ